MSKELKKGVQIFLVQDGKVLIAKSSIDDNYWKIPSGGIEGGEDMIEAARREAKEELNIEIEVIGVRKEKRKFDWPEDMSEKYCGQEQEVVVCRPLGKIIPNPDEIVFVEWIEPREAQFYFKYKEQAECLNKTVKEYSYLFQP